MLFGQSYPVKIHVKETFWDSEVIFLIILFCFNYKVFNVKTFPGLC